MALKSVRYEEVETYKACPESLRNRIVKNLLLEVTRKGMQPADLFQAEAQVLSGLCCDVIHIYITEKDKAIIALAGNTRSPNTHIAKVKFSTQTGKFKP